VVAFSIGGSERNKVTVEVVNYERAASGESHDDNWVNVAVRVSAGAFSGTFAASFITDEFVAFRSQLRELYKTLKGEATFTTMEGQLALNVVGDGRGGITLKGEALDQPGIGNCLTFELALDQTYLASTLDGLDQIIATFPVRANNAIDSDTFAAPLRARGSARHCERWALQDQTAMPSVHFFWRKKHDSSDFN
jgi:hypothetical protein